MQALGLKLSTRYPGELSVGTRRGVTLTLCEGYEGWRAEATITSGGKSARGAILNLRKKLLARVAELDKIIDDAGERR